jgi:dihydrofolate reductase
MQLSIDGFVAGPKGEMDWLTWNWDEEIKKYVNDLTDNIGCILMGRKMTDGFIGYWNSTIASPDNPEYAFGKKMIDTPKVVFSKTLEKSTWENTLLAKGDISEEINRLKKQPGKDIMAYGGANFVSSLVRQNLVDEYHLFINPVLAGNGMTIFNGMEQKMNLQLVKATPFECGIVVLCYRSGKE